MLMIRRVGVCFFCFGEDRDKGGRGDDKGRERKVYSLFLRSPTRKHQPRRIFERWTQWQPGHEVWRSYVNFEDRVASAAASAEAADASAAGGGGAASARRSSSGDPTLTRAVYERYVRALPTVDAYVAWAKWEMR